MLIFDIETDGLLNDLSKIHCMVTYDTETKDTRVYNSAEDNNTILGARQLQDATTIVGHNIIGFDLPAIRKCYPWFSFTGQVIDTLTLSRIYHSNMIDVDKKHCWRYMPLRLYGRHSLESYGYRLGCYKGEFGQTTDWSEWSQEMQAYCEQDVEVTKKLWNHFLKYLTSSN